MPLFEVETSAHIIITWAEDDEVAKSKTSDAYPTEEIIRLTKRPRDTWVISKAVLGIGQDSIDFVWIFSMNQDDRQ